MNTLHEQDESQAFETSVARIVHYLPFMAELADPPPECKAELLRKIRGQQRQDRILTPQKGFSYIPDSDTDGWSNHFDTGVQVKTLAKNPASNYSVLLMKFAPGAVLHQHEHSASEQCYVLEGSVQVQGNTLYPGDFHQADAMSTHSAIVSSSGAKLLLVIGMQDYKKAYWRVVGTRVSEYTTRLKSYLIEFFR